tara:strand:- start:204 stop:422 length:219 start_codon:yes stop_codon:yes gene_type:complete
MSYKRFNNWNSGGDQFTNGNGRHISRPRGYFRAVGSNRYGYNSSYRNGYGERISNPQGYFKAVGENRYGYSD